MNGFATKPVDWVSLSHEIARVLGLDQQAQAKPDLAAIAAPAREVLNRLAGLHRWAGKADVYAEALEHFNRQYAALATTLQMHAVGGSRQERPDLGLLDVMMLGMSGYEVCAALKASPETAATSVIFVTAPGRHLRRAERLRGRAVDYITKPVSPPIVRARVHTHLSLVRMEELRATRLEIVQRLGLAAEYKDNTTGLHVIRMSHFARILGIAAGLTEVEADDLLALDFLREQKGRHFDPALVSRLIEQMPAVRKVQQRWVEA